jgi:hypothetical protein
MARPYEHVFCKQDVIPDEPMIMAELVINLQDNGSVAWNVVFE